MSSELICVKKSDLQRLASVEAFVSAGTISPELNARIDLARVMLDDDPRPSLVDDITSTLYAQPGDQSNIAVGDKLGDATVTSIERQRDPLKILADLRGSSDEATLYYEAHITIEPVFDKRRELAAQMAVNGGFRLADLLMKKRESDTEERSSKDTFMTGHSKSYTNIATRTLMMVKQLKAAGFKVWRYKIEDTLMDSRSHDVWGLISGKPEWVEIPAILRRDKD